MLPIPILDNLKCKTFAWATLSLIAINVLVYVIQGMAASQGNGDWFMNTFSLVPGNITAAFQSAEPLWILQAVFSVFSSMFMHGGIDHIFGNMCFLFAFGRGLESRMGTKNFVVFYLVAGIASALGQYLASPLGMTHAVGASGAIAGVMAGYLTFFPRAKIWGFTIIVHPFPIPAPGEMRAFVYVILWIYMQFADVIPGLVHGASLSPVAYWMHIGGFAGGFIYAMVLKHLNPVSDVCVVPSTECKKCAEREEAEHNEHNSQQ